VPRARLINPPDVQTSRLHQGKTGRKMGPRCIGSDQDQDQLIILSPMKMQLRYIRHNACQHVTESLSTGAYFCAIVIRQPSMTTPRTCPLQKSHNPK
jgi:hypothetical protein